MIYDRDLKWVRRVSWVLLAVNGGLVIEKALRHDWPMMVASLIWFANVCFWMRMQKENQQVRDLMRLNAAAFTIVLETEGREHGDV